jgi:hypothetical protein
MNAEIEHQKRVDVTITYFQEREIQCVDFEEYVGHESLKRPDLLLPTVNTLIEVKTFAPQEQEIKEAQRIGKELTEQKASAYWHPTFNDRFGDHLRSARRKFRVYPTYHTAVLFYDLHSFVHEQTPEELLRGQEYFVFANLKADPKQVVQVGYGHNERHLRQDVNTEIGAVIFHTSHNTFKVFHNHFADKIRRIDKRIFPLSEDQHFEYIDDSVEPKIIRLD